MGLARATVHLLMREALRRPFGGTVLTLGRQHVYITAGETQAMAAKVGIRLVDLPIELHREPALAKQSFVSDDWLLRSLGFTDVVRIDYSNYETSDLIFDLNFAETPQSMLGRFEVVLDSGTLEHIFDIANGFRHCVRMVRPGGRVIHATPSSNCVEHGFFSVSPTLFADFYAASKFEVNKVWLCEIPLDLPRGIWKVYDYFGSSQRFIPLGLLNDKIWFTHAVVTAPLNPWPAVPQQWIYTQTWDQAEREDRDSDAKAEVAFEKGSKSERILHALEAWPWMQKRVMSLIVKWRKWIYGRRLRRKVLDYPYLGEF